MPISDPIVSALNTTVASRVAECRERIAAAVSRGGHGQSVTLVAVTKTHGPEAVLAALRAGVPDVGENRVQEAEQKMAQLSALLSGQSSGQALPIRWHLIGHLQRNKAKSATRFSLIHGMDSARLAESLDQAARAAGITLDVLVQVNVSGEGTKSGCAPSEVPVMSDLLTRCTSLRVMGAMTMAPFDAPESVLRRVFAGARNVRSRLQEAGHPAPWLSMGMSGDYEVAVEEGATHVRLGTVLFGDRE